MKSLFLSTEQYCSNNNGDNDDDDNEDNDDVDDNDKRDMLQSIEKNGYSDHIDAANIVSISISASNGSSSMTNCD